MGVKEEGKSTCTQSLVFHTKLTEAVFFFISVLKVLYRPYASLACKHSKPQRGLLLAASCQQGHNVACWWLQASHVVACKLACHVALLAMWHKQACHVACKQAGDLPYLTLCKLGLQAQQATLWLACLPASHNVACWWLQASHVVACKLACHVALLAMWHKQACHVACKQAGDLPYLSESLAFNRCGTTIHTSRFHSIFSNTSTVALFKPEKYLSHRFSFLPAATFIYLISLILFFFSANLSAGSRHTGHSEGFGFIEFVTRVAADRVLQIYNGQGMPNSEQVFRLNWATCGAGEKRNDGIKYTIFVRDLAADVTDYLLQETFKKHYTSVKGAKVVTDRLTGHSKGYGFVKFGDPNEQTRAMTEMNGV
ncbi:hypothetical protein ZIOFF_029363 [Zingiber officinale]|uniref:RRM domain-containing protein n=1 Tax=Zingiber officinale TaxID=94328 RepID=A0A8J5LAT2_ZINOF|nr:hypothetical protein ZIOFF_029363 [Zingiber officinale]